MIQTIAYLWSLSPNWWMFSGYGSPNDTMDDMDTESLLYKGSSLGCLRDISNLACSKLNWFSKPSLPILSSAHWWQLLAQARSLGVTLDFHFMLHIQFVRVSSVLPWKHIWNRITFTTQLFPLRYIYAPFSLMDSVLLSLLHKAG
jgi:hypothetical protein